jgi:hypothetical protein
MKGGAGAGAGRKPTGKKTLRLSLSLPLATVVALNEVGAETFEFVSEAILKALGNRRGKKNEPDASESSCDQARSSPR